MLHYNTSMYKENAACAEPLATAEADVDPVLKKIILSVKKKEQCLLALLFDLQYDITAGWEQLLTRHVLPSL